MQNNRGGPLGGKVAFITGGGSGINLGIAKAFATAGADVAICARGAERLEAAARELSDLGAKVCTFSADVRDGKLMDEALAQAESDLGRVDIVVCGAAGNFLCSIEEMSSNGFRSVVDIDLVGAFHTAKAALPALKRSRGSVIIISAGQALSPYHGQAHACAAKAGGDQLMRTMAIEWGPMGIRCNSIMPGFIDETEGVARIAGDRISKVIATTPLRRLGKVQDIGAAAVFLASDGAAFITGSVLVVDGGQYLGGSASVDY